MANQPDQKKSSRLALVLLIIVLVLACPFLATLANVRIARQHGLYVSPQEFAAAIAASSLPGYTSLVIERDQPFTGDNPDTNHRYVIWRACKESENNAAPECVSGGSNILLTRDGWVHMAESQFPGLVGVMMKVMFLSP